MNNVSKICLSTMCAGVLIAGVGAGIAFGEYSSLEFRVLEAPAGNGPVSASDQVAIPEQGDLEINAPGPNSCTLVEDESVAEGTILVSASCDAPATNITISAPYTAVYETRNYDEKTGEAEPQLVNVTRISVYPESDQHGSVETFMAYKDQILNGLKQGLICIPPDYYESFTVEIRVNPADADRVRIF